MSVRQDQHVTKWHSLEDTQLNSRELHDSIYEIGMEAYHLWQLSVEPINVSLGRPPWLHIGITLIMEPLD